MKTRVCDRFGIDVPIFGFSHCRDVVAAISAAGGFGVLGAATFDPDELEVELRWIDQHVGDHPYGVNVLTAASVEEGSPEALEKRIPRSHREFVEGLNRRFALPALRQDSSPPGSIFRGMEYRGTHAWAKPQLEVALRHPIRLLVSALGPAPQDVVARAHDMGVAVGGMVGAARHVEKHIANGADVVIAAGNEGAGHNSDVSTMVLTPEIVDAADGRVTVLSAGGIASGRQIAAALALGADGVWTGSLWVAALESDFPERAMDQIFGATSHDTVRTKSWSGKPTRFLRNPWIDAWEEREAPEPLPTPLQRMLVAPSHKRIVASGRSDMISVPMGQVVGQIKGRRRVREIMYDLQEEYAEAAARLSSLQETA